MHGKNGTENIASVNLELTVLCWNVGKNNTGKDGTGKNVTGNHST